MSGWEYEHSFRTDEAQRLGLGRFLGELNDVVKQGVVVLPLPFF